MAVDTSQLNTVISKIDQKYKGKVIKANQVENPERVTTGSLELDLAMGGGVPKGRRTRLAGAYSSGKSLICWNVIREFQKQGYTCVYYNVEKQFTPEFAIDRGVNVDDLIIVDETTIEGIGSILESMLGVAHLHIIDSTKAAVSLDALNCDISDWRPGLEARAWGKVWNVMNERFDYSNDGNTLIQVDQMRVKNFGSKGDGEEPAGGKVFDFASDMTVIFRKGTYLYYDDEGNLSDAGKDASQNMAKQHIPAGRLIQARVEKSRVSRPLLPATMYLDLNTHEYDREWELMKAGLEFGVFEDRGNGNYYYGDTRLYGKKKLRETIRGDLTMQEEITKKAMAAVLKPKKKKNPFMAIEGGKKADTKAPAKKPRAKTKAPAKAAA